ncbi:hypothetical protein KGMB01110_16600 [Mediterraneibacter butyricigenes]|uniref:Lipoprotein n=1 Tax=Mediterraneibacter butyricigenes TaxID=2316025 RepID=A0A391P016_9FIRM|nr:hypothetical protein [Mediterraneibacter butyricigenes]GCA67224.1 hypothetical protein KGMB01110_16600 [Mediterraneibacter butyricigenes]
MKKRTKKAMILFLATMAAAISVIGCGKKEEAKKTESDAKKSNTEETPKTTDSSASLPEIGEDGSFTSSDGKITMTLAGEGWTCTADTDNMKTLKSDTAVINVVYATGDGIEATMVPTDEEAYRKMVNGGMADLAFDVVSFETYAENGKTMYRGCVHYTGADNPDKYTVHYGVYGEGAGYTATAVLSVDDKTAVADLESSVYSMQVKE